MNLLQFLWPAKYRRHSQIASVSLDAARQCHAAVLRRLKPHAWNMSPGEARGYVRARAALVVHRKVASLLSQPRNVPSWVKSEIIRQATDEVVGFVLNDLAHRDPVQVPLRQAS